MKYSLLVFIILLFAICKVGFSQSNPRMQNEIYMRTVFLENFSADTLDRDIWLVENNYKRGLGLLVDNPLTLKLNSGNLELSMLYRPGSTTANYTGDYIGAEIISKTPYQYGSFECSSKYAQLNSSWPAFWIIGGDGTPCPPGGYGNEIDIAELMCKTSNLTIDHIIHRYYPTSDCSISNHDQKDAAYTQNILNNSYHTYKCIWSPTKIDYYIDGSLKHTVINTGQEWYPSLFLQVRLSQQIVDPIGSPVAPQTSYFDYVKVKQFFLAPQITCPTVICSTWPATMDVDLAATNITWALTPSNLFSGATIGTGKNVNIIPSSTSQGKGKITYTFTMSTDISNPKEIFTATKDIWIKGPDPSEMTFDVYKSNGVRAMQVGNTFLMCPNTTYQIYAMNSSPVPLSNYSWTVPSGWSRFYTYENIISINTNSSPGGPVIFTATNTVSGCNNTILPVTGYMGSMYNCGTYLIAVTPNPSTNETTLELSADGEKIVNENSQWELEVYDQQQGLKEKRAIIKGKQAKINTSNWKDGIYLVRIKIGEEIISEKLVVKH